MKSWHKIWITSLVGLVGIGLLSGCQSISSKNNRDNGQNNKTEAKTPVKFIKSSYQKSRIWYIVDANAFNKNQQNTIPDFAMVVKDGKAKPYRTLDYEFEYADQLDMQYRDQKKFVDLKTYSKLTDAQIKKQIGISDRAQYELNKLTLSPEQSVDAYQAPQFIKINTKINHRGETFTIPNGMRPKIMSDASPDANLDQDLIDLRYTLTEPLKKALTINHQQYIGYRSQDGSWLIITKKLPGDSNTEFDTK